MKIEVEIFNINKMEREICEVVESLDFFKEEIEMVKQAKQKMGGFLGMLGLEVEGMKLRVGNAEKFILYVFSRYFKGFKIIRTNGIEAGHPDYILKKGKKEIYLELKLGSDSLRQSQIKWFVENKDKQIRLIFLSWEDDYCHLKDGSI